MKIPALSVLNLLLSVFAHQSHVLAQGTTSNAECERVITGDYQLQAMECLNITIKAPPPVVLESTIDSENFICKNKPTLYAFSCIVYGDELIWYFNKKRVTAFFNDMVGRTFSISYPESAPVYNVTAKLTLVSNETFSQYNVPFYISILTIQSFNKSQADAPVVPFNVSCRTHCVNQNRTEVCQVKTYQVAETPTTPDEFTGTIQNVSDGKILGAKAIASLNWSLPDNNNEITIDYYEITLVGTNTNSTMSVCTTDQAQSLQTLSYKYVLSEGNYTAASITAVDLCGQKSEPTQLELTNATTNDICASNVDISDAVVVGVCVGVLVVLAAIVIALSIILPILCYCIYRHQSEQVEGNTS